MSGYRGDRLLTVAALCLAFLLTGPEAKADVQIAGLSDLNLGTWSGAGDLTGDIGHCVLNTVAPQKYSVEASGDGTGGAFALVNGLSSVPMQVSYNDGKGWAAMSPNTPLGSRKGLNAAKFSQCMSGKGQLFIRVLVLGTDLSLVDGGTYAGTIYLNVVPQ